MRLFFWAMLGLLLSAASSLKSVQYRLHQHKRNIQSKLPFEWSNSWVVEIEGGIERANEIAKRHGVTNLGQIGSLVNKYTFVSTNPATSSQQLGKRQSPYRMYSSADAARDDNEANLYKDPEITFVTHQQVHKHVKKNVFSLAAGNPIYSQQWYLNNTGQADPMPPFLDINVEGAWKLGYSGQEVLVGVVDDGVDSSHQDLRSNYNFENSYDYVDDDKDASPDSADSDHGTACAGLIAMELSNDVCGVGVAYKAQLSGIRLLGETANVGSQEAGSLSHNRNAIDIYSNSWGPSDFGFIVSGPDQIVQEAFETGAMKGRNGLGSIFTWAAGNGGVYLDSCAADGYVNSIYTIPVGAYNQRGGPASYDEKCSAKMTVSYVENTNSELLQVATTGLSDTCTLEFSGTSAATPMVSGVISLALEANPQLTWRDVQYLIVNTSNSEVLLANTDDYFTNGAGIIVSHNFGFGAIDAEAMVTRAQQWQTVPPQITDTIVPSVDSGVSNSSNPFISTLMYSGDIQYMEHLVVNMTLEVSNPDTGLVNISQAIDLFIDYFVYDIDNGAALVKRGDFEVSITSPSNTTSTLLFPRRHDTVNTEGYYQWPFLSVLHWGEDPYGEWTINVTWTNPSGLGAGMVRDVSVQFYGVSNDTASPTSMPTYNDTASPTSMPTSDDITASPTSVTTSDDNASPTSTATDDNESSSTHVIKATGMTLLLLIVLMISVVM